MQVGKNINVPNDKNLINANTVAAKTFSEAVPVSDAKVQKEENSVSSLKDGKAITSINLNGEPKTKGEEFFANVLAGLEKVDTDGGKDGKIFSLKGNEGDNVDNLIISKLKDAGLKNNEVGLAVVMIHNLLKYEDGKIDSIIDVPVNNNKGAKKLSVEFKQELEKSIKHWIQMLADDQIKAMDKNEYVPPFFITDKQENIKNLTTVLKALY
jgi:hypothetical protein